MAVISKANLAEVSELLQRAFKLLDEGVVLTAEADRRSLNDHIRCLEDRPEPKFKVGDWVRCAFAGHSGRNPFRITEVAEISREFCYYGQVGNHSLSCNERTLVPTNPPAPERFSGEHWKLIAGEEPLRFQDRAIQRCFADLRDIIEELLRTASHRPPLEKSLHGGRFAGVLLRGIA